MISTWRTAYHDRHRAAENQRFLCDSLTQHAGPCIVRSTRSVAAPATFVGLLVASACGSAQALPEVQAALSAKGERVVALELRAAPPATSVPIRTGVPFPSGALTSLNQLRLEASDGREVPAQFDTLAIWPNGSLKVVLVQFVGDLGRAQRYRLAYGAGVARKPPPARSSPRAATGRSLSIQARYGSL